MLLFVFIYLFYFHGTCYYLGLVKVLTTKCYLLSLALFEHKLIFTWSFINIYRFLEVNTKILLLARGENLISRLRFGVRKRLT